MASGIHISGIDDCLKTFDKAPKQMLKMSQTAMRQASRSVTKQMRPNIPKRWRSLLRYKLYKAKDGDSSVRIGLFNRKERNGKQSGNGVDDWFKAYWLNHGTLEGRDPTHKFQYPVKHSRTKAAKARRGKSGIQYQGWWAMAEQGYEDTFTEAFRQSLASQETKLKQK